MDIKLFGLLTIFLIAVLLPGADCWGRRRGRWRIRLRVSYSKACRWTCPRVCPRDNVCDFVCKKFCGREKLELEDMPQGQLKPIPRRFDFYDRNDDKSITMDEISTSLRVKPENCKETFTLADADNDGKLSKDEFENGPFVFAEIPGEPDDDDQGENGHNADDGNDGNQGNKPDQRSIEYDFE